MELEIVLSNIVSCMIFLLLCRGYFCHPDQFLDDQMRRIGCGVQSAFSYLKDADPPCYRSHRLGDRALWCVMEKLLPFRASVLPILLTGNIVHDRHVHA